MKFHFFLKEDHPNCIHLSVIFPDGTEQIFLTPFKIKAENWDQEKQFLRDNYKKHNKTINTKLGQLKIYLAGLKNKVKAPAAKTIIKNLEEACCQKEPLPKDTLIAFFCSYIKNRKPHIEASTYKRYKVFYNLLNRFEGTVMKRCKIQEVSPEFISQFVKFCKDEQYSENTIHRSIKFIKTVINFAEKNGTPIHFKNIEYKKRKSNTPIITLSEEEIQKIKTTKVPEELETAKKWLLISCYTGQRFSDFISFSKEKIRKIINKKCIEFTQKKTKKKILLPLHPVVLEILKENNNEFPKPMKLKDYNRQIKQIAQISGIKERLNTEKRIQHRLKKILTEKWDALTSHIGRRSFATNFYGKIPTPLLMSATGHSSEEIFIRYIQPIDIQRVLTLCNYFSLLNKRESYEPIS